MARNPADLTRRNLRAQRTRNATFRRQIRDLRDRVRALERTMQSLALRVVLHRR